MCISQCHDNTTNFITQLSQVLSWLLNVIQMWTSIWFYNNAKHWQGGDKTNTAVHCWGQCTLKTTMKKNLFTDPAIPILGTYPYKRIHRIPKSCMRMPLEALYSSPKPKSTQMPIINRTNKEILVYSGYYLAKRIKKYSHTTQNGWDRQI